MTDKTEKLRELLLDARYELRCYVEHAYFTGLRAQYPDQERRWRQDMDICFRIDKALKEMDEEK